MTLLIHFEPKDLVLSNGKMKDKVGKTLYRLYKLLNELLEK